MSRSNNDALFNQVSSKYIHLDLMKRDVSNALQHYRGLTLNLKSFVFNDGSENELLNLDGTIPVPFKGNTYNIPVVIWLLYNHPYNPPMCFVKPTQTMLIKVSRHVDQTGKVYLPYLHEWKYGSSDVLGLIQVMIIVFGEQPPVYSKSLTNQQQNVGSSVGYPPYPGSYTPMPSVGNTGNQPSGYPPYSMSNSSGPGYPPTSSYQPPYPASSQSNYNSSYPPYPGYPNTTSSTNNTPYALPNVAGGYLPYPPTSSAQPVGSSNNDMPSEKEQRLLQLSAVENKLRHRLDETFSQMQAEIEVLKKTRTELSNGKARLNEITQKLESEHGQLDHNIRILRDKDAEMKDVLEKMDSQNEMDIDDAVTTTAPLYKQLLQLYAEENATQDTIYYLGEGLRRGVIDLDVFLKHVRALSRKQFMLRALMQKCREKAGLVY